MSDDQIREIRAQLNKVLHDQKRLLDALLGDEEMGHVGMVSRMESVEVTVNEIQQERRDEKAQRKGALWVLTTACTLGSGFVAWLVGIYQQSK